MPVSKNKVSSKQKKQYNQGTVCSQYNNFKSTNEPV